MKVIFITGDDLRHFHMVKCFSKYFEKFNWIVERRDISLDHKKLIRTSSLYKKHIQNFKKEQKILFKNSIFFYNKYKKQIIYIDRNKINPTEFTKKILNQINIFEPNILISYGCQKIDISKIKKKSLKCLNVHGGLLPYYRGVNTNFWPHMNLESNYIGFTLHEISSKIDSGKIFFQTSIDVNKSDTVNKLSCRAVKIFNDIVPKKLHKLLTDNFYQNGFKTKHKYKAYTKKDFKPKYIKLAYKNLGIFKNLENKKKPKLINIF